MENQSDGCIVRLDGVFKGYALGKTFIPVLYDINLTIREGEFVVIMGPSGSGKSTLLNILGCLDLPDKGGFFFKGERISELSSTAIARFRNQKIGFVFQNFNLFPKMTVQQNIGLPLIYGDLPPWERKKLVQTILKKLDLYDRRTHYPNEISGGQKQRTAIGRALCNSPSLILADEPTGNLDMCTTREIMEILQTLNQEGHTMVVITHDPNVAAFGKIRYQLVDGRLSLENGAPLP
jgi:putative ABC transport system ATP-binding protein